MWISLLLHDRNVPFFDASVPSWNEEFGLYSYNPVGHPSGRPVVDVQIIVQGGSE
jgi:hypothetical protein